MKLLATVTAVLSLCAAAAASAGVTGLAYESAPSYFTTQPSTPANQLTPYNARHRPEYNGPLDGVARLLLNVDSQGFGTLCSGALLGSGYHILTAAHCVTDGNGVMDVDLVGRTNVAQFGVTQAGATPYTGALTTVGISGIKVLPGWNGDYLFNGFDLAIITLAEAAPADATRYDIYTGTDELGQSSQKAGWGTIGLGSTGATSGSGWRTGKNVWEMTAEDFWGPGNAASSILMYDFDNGQAANDAFGVYFGVNDLGLGDDEVMSGPGDSGGPTFIDGKVAGITSFGLTFFDRRDANGNLVCDPGSGNPDVVCGLNNTFGEFGGDTRVSAFADWIRANAVPAPNGLALLGAAMLALGLSRRRQPAGK